MKKELFLLALQTKASYSYVTGQPDLQTRQVVKMILLLVSGTNKEASDQLSP
jgi:hypothetical protein